MPLKKIDKAIWQLIQEEDVRQAQTINLIASENYARPEVLEALASSFNNKYAEGYPGKRYYPGNEVADKLENLVIDRAKKLFNAEHANIQALSGGPANLAIYSALLEPGDKIMALKLSHGGHLSHGHPVNFSGKNYSIVFYEVDAKSGKLDMKKIREQAKAEKPKLIIAGASAYPRDIDWKAFGSIARSVGAYLLADISHTAGLVAAKTLANPFPYADIVMTTTHKSLRGPRGAIIMCKASLAEAIDRGVFPGFQGGPHLNSIAAIGVALKLASENSFKRYASQVIKNSQSLANALQQLGHTLVSGGTDTHLLVVDLTNIGISGKTAEKALAQAGITVSRSTIPNDPRPPYDPSGIRIGTPAITSRGFKTGEMVKIAELIHHSLQFHDDPQELAKISKNIKSYLKKYPILA